jgi:rhamnosyltransferase
MIQQSNIAAVVVLYNTKSEDLARLQKLETIFKKIYVINNSPDSVVIKDFFEISQFKNLELINCSSNWGIASALNIGCKKAIQDNFEWVITLDQDSNFEDYILNLMIQETKGEEIASIGLITPLIKNHETLLPHNPDKKIEFLDYCITSGNLVNLNNWGKIGGYNEEYFIYHVDNDFCLKLKQNNLKIIQVNSAIMNHEIGERGLIKILGKNVIWDKHSPIANYYITRNTIYFLVVLFKNGEYSNFFKIIKYHLIKENLKTIFFQGDRFVQFKYIILGYWDAVRSKKGKL